MQAPILEKIYPNSKNYDDCLQKLFTHDIANIINIISNSFELCGIIMNRGAKKEELVEFFQCITEQINRGKLLVKNLRNIYYLEECPIFSGPVDLLENIDAAKKFICNSFPTKEINIALNTEESNYSVFANNLLVEVFENLFTNSVIYNKRKMIKIQIYLSEVKIKERRFIKIQCKDNGIGINNDRKMMIFETNYKNKNSKGMGIGLSLIAKLIELWGGKIWIEDRVEGNSSKGSNFVLLIPKFDDNNML